MTAKLRRKPDGRGRPRTNKIAVMVRLKADTNVLLYEAAGKAGISKSEFVERAILSKIKLDQFREDNE